jgi:hypothetical protein
MQPTHQGVFSRIARAAMVLSMGGVSTQLWAAPPVSGPTPWAVILCQFQDNPGPSAKPLSFFQDFVSKRGTGGLADFWSDMSYGQINLTGSVIGPGQLGGNGWYTVDQPFTYYPNSLQRFQACVSAAQADFNYPDFFGILVLLKP